MPWSDPARRFEPATDVALRAELRDLLGLGAAEEPKAAAPTPELTALADDLRREALRRNRTQRQRPTWGLLAAAALPLLATLVGLGTWGVHQRQRAEALALQTQRQEQELSRLVAAHATEVAQERQAKEAAQQQLVLASRKSSQRGEPYLVIPIEKPLRGGALEDTQRVKHQP